MDNRESVISFLKLIQKSALNLNKKAYFTPDQLRQHRLDSKSLKKMLKKEGKR